MDWGLLHKPLFSQQPEESGLKATFSDRCLFFPGKVQEPSCTILECAPSRSEAPGAQTKFWPVRLARWAGQHSPG